MTIPPPRELTWAPWCGWALTGALGALSIVGMWTIGIFVAPIAAALFIVMLLRAANASAWGLLAGPGSMSLWLAWANRLGPGEHCEQIPNGIRCDETLWEPAPFLLIGLLLVSAAVTGFTIARKRSRSRRAAPTPLSG